VCVCVCVRVCVCVCVCAREREREIVMYLVCVSGQFQCASEHPMWMWYVHTHTRTHITLSLKITDLQNVSKADAYIVDDIARKHSLRLPRVEELDEAGAHGVVDLEKRAAENDGEVLHDHPGVYAADVLDDGVHDVERDDFARGLHLLDAALDGSDDAVGDGHVLDIISCHHSKRVYDTLVWPLHREHLDLVPVEEVLSRGRVHAA
jgi:hypothetical protein